MKKLAILGASGHGKVIADAALSLGWGKVVFFDDAWPGKANNGHWPVVSNGDELLNRLNEFAGVIVGIGDCQIRAEKHRVLRAANAPLVSIVHPSAQVSSFAEIGLGSVLCAGAIMNVDSVVGEACIVNTGATIDHDCGIADATHVAPGAHISGDVRIGSRSWLGVGAIVRQGIHIGSDVTVGAGAVVVQDIGDGATVVGNPAKVMQQL